MASQGQRFRRKSLRRGYKVDEVDAFLDRVEATLEGQPVGAPVSAQEVHDVVFRVRFNGYDEWQVDLHLDRVERQLADVEEQGGRPAPAADPHPPERMGPAERMGPPDQFGPAERMGPPDQFGPAERMGPPDQFGPAERMGPPDQFGPPGRMGPAERMGPPDQFGPPGRMGPPDERGIAPEQQPMPPRFSPAQPGVPYSRYDETTGSFAGGHDAPRGGYDAPRGGYEPPRGPAAPHGPSGPHGPGAPHAPGGSHGPGGLSRGPATGGYGPDEPRFDGFEAGRHGRADMTTEMRMPERGREMGGLPASQPGFAGSPEVPGPPMVAPPPREGDPSRGGPPMAGPPGSDLYRVDQIRRSFQVRRFGSGYDPDQVDRFFDSLLGGMQGRNPMPVNPHDLGTLRFGLVQGGYFEEEVDTALKNVQDVLLGR
ncbi:DivIVA domain-containing protein [Salinispora pacifica]|uniref:DivIVA domain-containing protein n=1 Tax=Salinispora pacifica TaxID=351187 RepID=UPI00048707AF|nr:DivIVA domain-containing protein [Salinispora pacifica]